MCRTGHLIMGDTEECDSDSEWVDYDACVSENDNCGTKLNRGYLSLRRLSRLCYRKRHLLSNKTRSRNSFDDVINCLSHKSKKSTCTLNNSSQDHKSDSSILHEDDSVIDEQTQSLLSELASFNESMRNEDAVKSITTPSSKRKLNFYQNCPSKTCSNELEHHSKKQKLPPENDAELDFTSGTVVCPLTNSAKKKRHFFNNSETLHYFSVSTPHSEGKCIDPAKSSSVQADLPRDTVSKSTPTINNNSKSKVCGAITNREKRRSESLSEISKSNVHYTNETEQSCHKPEKSTAPLDTNKLASTVDSLLAGTASLQTSDATATKAQSDEDDNLTIDVRVREKRKRKKSEEINLETLPSDVLELIASGIDEQFELKAERNKLSSRQVKNIIKTVISNEDVVAMLRNTLELNSDPALLHEARVTRAKTKELQQSLGCDPTPVSGPQPDNAAVVKFGAVEFPEEDQSDEEYRPELDKGLNSDDDSFMSPGGAGSDLGSPSTSCRSSLVTPLPCLTSPRCASSFSTPRASSQKKVPLATQAVLNDAAANRALNFEKDRIYDRTRSKLPLKTVPLEVLESQFVPPDVTVDMYMNSSHFDPDYNTFIDNLWRTQVDAGPDEDNVAEDPDYNYNEDHNFSINDIKDEFRKGKSVEVPKKEKRDLLNDWLEILKELDGDSADCGTVQQTSSGHDGANSGSNIQGNELHLEKLLSESGTSASAGDYGGNAPIPPTSSAAHYVSTDGKIAAESRDSNSRLHTTSEDSQIAPLPRLPVVNSGVITRSCLVRMFPRPAGPPQSESQSANVDVSASVSGASAIRVEAQLADMTALQLATLRRQMIQHCQLLATSVIMSVGIFGAENTLRGCVDMLRELEQQAACHTMPNSSSVSFFHPPNLLPALAAVHRIQRLLRKQQLQREERFLKELQLIPKSVRCDSSSAVERLRTMNGYKVTQIERWSRPRYTKDGKMLRYASSVDAHPVRGRLRAMQVRVMLHSSAFPYPELLPNKLFRRTDQLPFNRRAVYPEDMLLAMAACNNEKLMKDADTAKRRTFLRRLSILMPSIMNEYVEKHGLDRSRAGVLYRRYLSLIKSKNIRVTKEDARYKSAFQKFSRTGKLEVPTAPFDPPPLTISLDPSTVLHSFVSASAHQLGRVSFYNLKPHPIKLPALRDYPPDLLPEPWTAIVRTYAEEKLLLAGKGAVESIVDSFDSRARGLDSDEEEGGEAVTSCIQTTQNCFHVNNNAPSKISLPNVVIYQAPDGVLQLGVWDPNTNTTNVSIDPSNIIKVQSITMSSKDFTYSVDAAPGSVDVANPISVERDFFYQVTDAHGSIVWPLETPAMNSCGQLFSIVPVVKKIPFPNRTGGNRPIIPKSLTFEKNSISVPDIYQGRNFRNCLEVFDKNCNNDDYCPKYFERSLSVFSNNAVSIVDLNSPSKRKEIAKNSPAKLTRAQHNSNHNPEESTVISSPRYVPQNEVVVVQLPIEGTNLPDVVQCLNTPTKLLRIGRVDPTVLPGTATVPYNRPLWLSPQAAMNTSFDSCDANSVTYFCLDTGATVRQKKQQISPTESVVERVESQKNICDQGVLPRCVKEVDVSSTRISKCYSNADISVHSVDESLPQISGKLSYNGKVKMPVSDPRLSNSDARHCLDNGNNSPAKVLSPICYQSPVKSHSSFQQIPNKLSVFDLSFDSSTTTPRSLITPQHLMVTPNKQAAHDFVNLALGFSPCLRHALSKNSSPVISKCRSEEKDFPNLSSDTWQTTRGEDRSPMKCAFQSNDSFSSFRTSSKLPETNINVKFSNTNDSVQVNTLLEDCKDRDIHHATRTVDDLDNESLESKVSSCCSMSRCTCTERSFHTVNNQGRRKKRHRTNCRKLRRKFMRFIRLNNDLIINIEEFFNSSVVQVWMENESFVDLCSEDRSSTAELQDIDVFGTVSKRSHVEAVAVNKCSSKEIPASVVTQSLEDNQLSESTLSIHYNIAAEYVSHQSAVDSRPIPEELIELGVNCKNTKRLLNIILEVLKDLCGGDMFFFPEEVNSGENVIESLSDERQIFNELGKSLKKTSGRQRGTEAKGDDSQKAPRTSCSDTTPVSYSGSALTSSASFGLCGSSGDGGDGEDDRPRHPKRKYLGHYELASDQDTPEEEIRAKIPNGNEARRYLGSPESDDKTSKSHAVEESSFIPVTPSKQILSFSSSSSPLKLRPHKESPLKKLVSPILRKYKRLSPIKTRRRTLALRHLPQNELIAALRSDVTTNRKASSGRRLAARVRSRSPLRTNPKIEKKTERATSPLNSPHDKSERQKIFKKNDNISSENELSMSRERMTYTESHASFDTFESHSASTARSDAALYRTAEVFDDQTDFEHNDDHVAAFLKAASTINSDGGDASDGVKVKGRRRSEVKRSRIAREHKRLQAHINALSQQQDIDARNKLFASLYLSRVLLRLSGDSGAVHRFLEALHYTVTEAKPIEELYYEITKEILVDHPDLATEFLGFLLPGQAIALGIYEEWLAHQRLLDLLYQLQLLHEKQPALLQKILRKLAAFYVRLQSQLEAARSQATSSISVISGNDSRATGSASWPSHTVKASLDNREDSKGASKNFLMLDDECAQDACDNRLFKVPHLCPPAPCDEAIVATSSEQHHLGSSKRVKVARVEAESLLTVNDLLKELSCVVKQSHLMQAFKNWLPGVVPSPGLPGDYEDIDININVFDGVETIILKDDESGLTQPYCTVPSNICVGAQQCRNNPDGLSEHGSPGIADTSCPCSCHDNCDVPTAEDPGSSRPDASHRSSSEVRKRKRSRGAAVGSFTEYCSNCSLKFTEGQVSLRCGKSLKPDQLSALATHYFGKSVCLPESDRTS